MRQQHHQAALSHPLRLSRADELIDDALRCVVEVAELRFPQDQRVGVGHRVAELEAEHAVLRQRAVADGVRRLIRVQVAQRTVGGLVDFLMVQHVMTMREGAALHILTRQAHVDAFLHQRSKGEGLGQRPIGDAVVHHVLAGGQHAQQAFVDQEPGGVRWRRREAVADVDQRLLDHAGLRHLQRVLAFEEPGPRRVQPVLVLDVRLHLRLLHRILADLLVLVAHRLHFLGGDDAFGDELVGVDVQHRLRLLDAFVHERLGEHRLVDLVVSVAAVADDVDDDVLVEGRAPFSGDAAHVHDRLGIVGVDVEDRSVDDARHIRAVRR